jgi:LPXTG-motif cell wall-anchored protein
MTVRKGDVNTKNLADVIDLTVTRVSGGVDEPIHTGVKLSELGTRETSISFTNNETAVYRFEAYFTPVGNEYMAASTDFQVIFTVTTTTVTPDRPYVPGGPGGGDDDDYGGVPNITRPTVVPTTAAATTAITANTIPIVGMTPDETTATPTTAPPEVETTTTQEYFEIPENTIPVVGMTPDETTATTSNPETPVSDAPEQPTTITATKTEYYDFEPEDIPLIEFLDKLPTTGETTNPLVYQMTGLGFMFAGGAVIFGVSRKNKQKN